VSAPLEDLVISAAAGGIPGSLRELPHQELPEKQAHELVEAAQHHQLAGVMLASVQAGELRLPAVATEALVDAHVREMTTCLHLEHELLDVTALFEAAGIESRVLDGTAVAHLDYQDPTLRAFTHLELLVRAADLGRATELLRRSGWRATPAGEGLVRSTTLVAPSNVRLDLHTTVERAPGGLNVNVQELWSEGQDFLVGPQRLTALDSEQRLLHACCDAMSGGSPPAPVLLRDIVEMALFGRWSHTRVLGLAASWKAQSVLAQAVLAAWQRLAIADVTGLSVWAQGYRPPFRSQQLPRDKGTGVTLAARPTSWARFRAFARRT
jgi:hypothetical protein